MYISRRRQRREQEETEKGDVWSGPQAQRGEERRFCLRQTGREDKEMAPACDRLQRQQVSVWGGERD